MKFSEYKYYDPNPSIGYTIDFSTTEELLKDPRISFYRDKSEFRRFLKGSYKGKDSLIAEQTFVFNDTPVIGWIILGLIHDGKLDLPRAEEIKPYRKLDLPIKPEGKSL